MGGGGADPSLLLCAWRFLFEQHPFMKMGRWGDRVKNRRNLWISILYLQRPRFNEVSVYNSTLIYIFNVAGERKRLTSNSVSLIFFHLICNIFNKKRYIIGTSTSSWNLHYTRMLLHNLSGQMVFEMKIFSDFSHLLLWKNSTPVLIIAPPYRIKMILITRYLASYCWFFLSFMWYIFFYIQNPGIFLLVHIHEYSTFNYSRCP